MPVRHGQTPARRLYLPESVPPWQAGRGFVVRALPWTVEKLRVLWRSGVSAERRHLKLSETFAAVEIIRLATDQDWLHKATKEIAKYWRKKRERRISPQSATFSV